jgi:hypothetical protein
MRTQRARESFRVRPTRGRTPHRTALVRVTSRRLLTDTGLAGSGGPTRMNRHRGRLGTVRTLLRGARARGAGSAGTGFAVLRGFAVLHGPTADAAGSRCQ